MKSKSLRAILQHKSKRQLINIILAIFHIAPKNIKHRIKLMAGAGHKIRSKIRKHRKKSKHRKSKHKKHSSGRSKLSIKRERIRNLNKGRKKLGLKLIPIPKR